MKKTFLCISLLSSLVVMILVACTEQTTAGSEPVTISQDSLVKRGAYLVTTNVCDDCHSPKRMGPHGPEIIPELRFSGYRQSGTLPPVDTNIIKKGWTLFNADLTAAVGAWGVSYAANLTSDPTGTGNWSEAQFFKAIREGKWKGLDNTRPLLPPMPWQNFSKLSDQDIKAIFAFLKTTKPVENVVPAPKPLSELK